MRGAAIIGHGGERTRTQPARGSGENGPSNSVVKDERTLPHTSGGSSTRTPVFLRLCTG